MTDPFGSQWGTTAPAQPAKEQRPGRAGVVLGSLALVVAVAAMGLAGYQYRQVSDLQDQAAGLGGQVAGLQGDLSDSQTRLATVRDQLEQAQADLDSVTTDVKSVGSKVDQAAKDKFDAQKIAKAAMPSVVTVYCGDAQGSGFVVAMDDIPPGFASAVLTNEHVIDQCTDGTEVQVRKGDSTPQAQLASWDAANDLALIWVHTALPALDPAGTPVVGDPVVAIGSPYGLDGTVTAGLISNIHPKLFQTDAAINHGNSGGPLLDRYGDVLGVTTFALTSSDGTGEGTNFAVRMRVRCEQLVTCS